MAERNNLLTINKIWSEDPSQLAYQVQTAYREIAGAVNHRDIGEYQEVEVLAGQQFFVSGDNQEKRDVFRKVVDLGTLVTGLNMVAHGLAVGTPSTFTFTKLYGTIQNQITPLFLPIPNDNIHFEVDATNISITIPITYNGFTGIAVLEYLKE